MKKLFASLRGGHRPDIDALSALVDGALDAASARALEAHAASCAACAAELDGMRRVKTMLSAMPEMAHPRSFRLRQADVEAPARAKPRATGVSIYRAMPVMSALGAIAFAVVLATDVSTRGDDDRLAASRDSNNTAAQRASEMAYDEMASEIANDGTSAGAVAPNDATPPALGLSGDDAPVPSLAPPEDAGARTETDAASGAIGGPDTSGEADADMKEQVQPADQFDAAQADRLADDDDGRNAFLIIEIIAAGVAIAAGAAFVITRRNQGGVS